MTERDVIGLFGKMNAGKSTVMNLITQQESSLTDQTPGTTADTKIALIEIHGIGPVKLLDTAGFDEKEELGSKKRKKVLSALRECDLVLLIIDPSTKNCDVEKRLIIEAKSEGKQVLTIFNVFSEKDKSAIPDLLNQMPFLKSHPAIELSATDNSFRPLLLDWIINSYVPRISKQDLLPFVIHDQFYILNIPMDEETPPGRLLRPQAMAEEYIVRHWAYPVSFRMNLAKARAGDSSEKTRWDQFINNFSTRPKAIITDSQAIDILKDWTPDDIPLTTFSIMMINYMSRGSVLQFAEAVKVIDTLQPDDQVLIAEACNHSRIREDIGTVQIPKLLHERCPGVKVDFLFGRDLLETIENINYKLVIHCGGCMITSQKMAARLKELDKMNIPVTNYGILLSYIRGEDVLKRVMDLWK